MDLLRIALLHLAPRLADIPYNQHLVETAIHAAARAGADCILTPELITTGYTFTDRLGTDWISVQPDPWVCNICELAYRLQVAIFLGHVERDAVTGALHNSVFAIAPSGELVGRHRKINTLRIGSEAWSTPGTQAQILEVPPCGDVGILICADAYSPGIAEQLRLQGARLLVSAAAWAPGLHGPNGEWERISQDTGLPVFVCNRTGDDTIMSFAKAESVVAYAGQRVFSCASETSAVFVLEWSLPEHALRSSRILPLHCSQMEQHSS
jgi:predicted amidohydrolase